MVLRPSHDEQERQHQQKDNRHRPERIHEGEHRRLPLHRTPQRDIRLRSRRRRVPAVLIIMLSEFRRKPCVCKFSMLTCSPSRCVWNCCRRNRNVVAAAIPKPPPRLRIRLNMLVALPISSFGMGSIVAVVSGTNSIASAAP